jgi:hypothetical protein
MFEAVKYFEQYIEEENSIVFVPKTKEFGVPIRDGGSSFLVMKYCPWCGKEL